MRQIMMKTKLPLIVLCLSTIMIAGCGTQDENVRSELKSLTANLKPKIKEIPGAVAYQAFSYQAQEMQDPFATIKMVTRLSDGASSPDSKRTKEALEAFPLESIKMVGYIKQAGKGYVVVNVDGYLYHLTVGKYIGQNYGRVVSATEHDFKIKEMFQEQNGEWNEREVIISIQDTNEAKNK